MKYIYTLLSILSSYLSLAQDSLKAPEQTQQNGIKHCWILSASIGVVDYYRTFYDLPHDFERATTSGLPPVYARAEYGLGKNLSIGASLTYDAFTYNNKVWIYHIPHSEELKDAPDKFQLFGTGVFGSYHAKTLFRIRSIKPFLSAGLSVNWIQHSAAPQLSFYPTASTAEIIVSPIVKAGVLIALVRSLAAYADIGYDKQSLASIGLSYTFNGH